MISVRIIGLVLLSIYSAALITLEIVVSQDYVRYYFTDIVGPVRFIAVNTTLSMVLFLSAALVFAVCVLCLPDVGSKRERTFCVSQILIFGYLGLDDRFLFHEWAGVILGIDDAFIILALAVLEFLILLLIGDLKKRSGRTQSYICLAGFFSGVMIFIDGWVPLDLVPRLSLEDLSKTWATAFIFLFAWSICETHIRALKKGSLPPAGSGSEELAASSFT